MSGAYRDGVFSVSSPAPRYGSLTTSFEDGSLGSLLEESATEALDPALRTLAAELTVALASPPNPTAARYGAAALYLSQQALSEGDFSQKMALAVAAGYAASAFGLPPDALLQTVGQICSTFAMTGNQRAALHQQGASLLHSYLLQKGSPMSGVFQDGVLGSVYRDGVLGALKPPMAMITGDSRKPSSGSSKVTQLQPRPVKQMRATRDGSLGHLMHQNHAFADGSLGHLMHQNHAFADGSLGRMRVDRSLPWAGARAPQSTRPRKMRAVAGGCGCSGIGDDAIATEPAPFYKNPLVIGGAAVGLGVVIYALTR